jgi:lipopolysaccharide transport system permease protein
LAAPVAMIISNLFKFGVQMLMFLVFLFYYRMQEGSTLHFTPYLAFFPLIVLLMGGMALGVGIIISSFTTKYRDLTYFISFGVQLLMYATPVIYPTSAIPDDYKWFVHFNPIAPLVEMFRLGFTGTGTVTMDGMLYSAGFTLGALLLGTILFHRTEKTFMDTV